VVITCPSAIALCISAFIFAMVSFLKASNDIGAIFADRVIVVLVVFSVRGDCLIDQSDNWLAAQSLSLGH
jgi:hypothetical protein